VIQGGLQALLYQLKDMDMHTLTLKVEGDMKFQRALNVKLDLKFDIV
jgi:hypothetical protein